jgi:hypothetical protein
MGVYSKAGSPDLFVLASTAQDFLESNDTPDETPLPAELINFVKGKKYVFVVVGGTDIVAGISNGNPFPPGMPVVTKK